MKTARIFISLSIFLVSCTPKVTREPFKELYDVGLFSKAMVSERGVLSKAISSISSLVLSGGTMMISVLPMSSIKLKGVLFDFRTRQILWKDSCDYFNNQNEEDDVAIFVNKGLLALFDRLQGKKIVRQREITE